MAEVTYSNPTTAPWLTNTNSSTANKTSTVVDKTSLGKDDFLKLLLTELKYQDPTSPMDNKEFISQMSSFSSLEQMQNLNKGFTSLADSINNTLVPNMMLQQSGNMIGKDATYSIVTTDSDGKEQVETKTGAIQSVVMKSGTPYYVIDGKEVAISDVTKVEQGGLSTSDQILLNIFYSMVQQTSDMIGKEVSYLSPSTSSQTGFETKTGTIQSLIMKDGIPYYMIDGKEVAATNITKMSQGSSNDQTLNSILNTLKELKELLGKGSGSNG